MVIKNIATRFVVLLLEMPRFWPFLEKSDRNQNKNNPPMILFKKLDHLYFNIHSSSFILPAIRHEQAFEAVDNSQNPSLCY